VRARVMENRARRAATVGGGADARVARARSRGACTHHRQQAAMCSASGVL